MSAWWSLSRLRPEHENPLEHRFDVESISAAIALFLSSFYIIRVNPAVLEGAGITSGVVTGTLLLIVLAALASALYARIGLLIAPAVGISAFLKEYHESTGVPGPILFWSIAVAGVIYFFVSIRHGARKAVIDALPTPVKTGLKGALAVLFLLQGQKILEEETLRLEASDGSEVAFVALLVSIGATVIMTVFFGMRQVPWVRNKLAWPRRSVWWKLLAYGEFVYATLFVILLLWLFAPNYLAAQSLELNFDMMHWVEGYGPWPTIDGSTFGLTMLFVAAVLFLLLTDIPGTPEVVIPDERKKDFEVEGEGFDRSYHVDSVMAAAAPALGTTAPIHYAENEVLKSFDRYGSPIAWILFGLYGAILVGSLPPLIGMSPIDVGRLLPNILAVPILWFIAMLIIYNGVMLGKPKADEATVGSNEHAAQTLFMAMPVVAAAFVTRFFGLDYGFIAAILVAALVGWATQAKEYEERRKNFLKIVLAAAIFLALRLGLKFFKWWNDTGAAAGG